MKILVVTPQMTTGGAERVVSDLCSGLVRRSHAVSLASSGGYMADELVQLGVQTFAVKGLESKVLPVVAIGASRLAGVLRIGRYDLVNSHSYLMSLVCFTALRLAQSRAKHVFTLHLVEQPWYYGVMGRTLGWTVDQVITVCESNKQRLVEHGVLPSKISVIHNGIDLRRFPFVDRQSRNDSIRIGIVARLVERKGHADLLGALSRLIAQPGQFPGSLDIIGDGPLKGNLEQLVHSLGLSDRVRFLGERHDIPRLLEELDMLVLPSSYEGFPVSIVEGLCSGLPVVATAVDGIPEMIRHGETGLLVQPHDIEGLAQAIDSIARDANLRHRLSQQGARLTREKFSTDHMVGAYEETFQALTHSSRPSRTHPN